MKVKDLIAWLSCENPELEVIMQKDAEGNGYSPLSNVDLGRYLADTTWFGERSEDDSGVLAVFLVPVN